MPVGSKDANRMLAPSMQQQHNRETATQPRNLKRGRDGDQEETQGFKKPRTTAPMKEKNATATNDTNTAVLATVPPHQNGYSAQVQTNQVAQPDDDDGAALEAGLYGAFAKVGQPDDDDAGDAPEQAGQHEY